MAKGKSGARSFLFASFQGGIGKTFIASKFAHELHESTGKPVALFEFNTLRPSTIVENLPDGLKIQHNFLDYYTSNWPMMSAERVSKFFTSHHGVYYIPFCGHRKDATLQPKFNLSEEDLIDSLDYLIDLLIGLDGYIVFDIAFRFTPLSNYLLYRADVICYIYNSQIPGPTFASKFLEEAKCRKGIENKILWIRNHAEEGADENSLFDPEFKIPIGGEISDIEGADLNKRFPDLVKKAMRYAALGKSHYEIPDTLLAIPNEIMELQQRLRADIVGDLDRQFGISDHELRENVERKIDEELVKNKLSDIPGHNNPAEIKKYLLDEILGLGPLEIFMRDAEVDEIMVNGPDKVFIEKRGKLELTGRRFTNEDQVRTVIERILMPIGRTINERNPYVDARLGDGSRVHAIIPPLSLTGPMITIRKFSKVPYNMDDLVSRFKSLSQDAAEFLRLCVHLKKNIIVSGGASSGKTTLLNVLSNFIQPNERIICIEDSAELRLSQNNLGRLEARQQGTEAKNQVTIRDLVRNALRMRPDRIIVGECRGAEAIDMLQAMNTGHDGSLTTLHANTSRDALARLETMVLMAGVDLPLRAIREQIASSVNIIVQTGRLADGKRRVLEIIEVLGYEDSVIKTQAIYKFEKRWINADGRVVGEIVPTGFLPEFMKTIPGSFIEQHAHLFKKKTSNKAKQEEDTL